MVDSSRQAGAKVNVEITPDMIKAGAAVLWAYAVPENVRLHPEDIVGEFYEAMRRVVRDKCLNVRPETY